MPPFTFSPYHNQGATNTIASLIERQGEIPAEAAIRSGQVWGNAATQVAQIASQVPQEIRREKIVDTQQKQANINLSEQQRAIKLRDAMSQAIIATPMLDEGGLSVYDIPAITKNLPDEFRANAGDVAKSLSGINEAFRQENTAKRAIVAQGAGALIQAGSPPDLTLHFIDTLVKNHTVPADQADYYKQAIAKDPASTEAILRQFVPAQKVERGAPGSMSVDPLTGKPIEGTEIADPKAAAAEKLAAARADETARHNKEMERIQGLTVGQAAARTNELARHNKAMEPPTFDSQGRTGASAASSPASGNNEAFLSTLPTALADKVKALVEGRLSLPSRFSKGDPYWESILDAAVQYDPSFDATNYNARSKTRADLTSPSGTGGKTINALNTALEHVGKLSDLIEKLDNSDTLPGLVNAPYNLARTKLGGSTAVTDFKAAAPQVMKEIERAWRQASGSTADIQQLIESLGENLGRQQQRSALNQFVDLIIGKLNTTETQRDNAMGPVAGKAIPVLFDKNKSIIDKIQGAGLNDRNAGAWTEYHGICTDDRWQVHRHGEMMPTYEAKAPDGRTVSANGPTPPTEAEWDEMFKSVPPLTAVQPSARSSVPAIATALGAATPLVEKGAEALATAPNLPKLGSTVGRVIGAVAPVVGGAIEAGPLGGMIGLSSAAKGAWAGGKVGWFSAKLLQQASAPVAKMLEAVGPYMSGANAISAGGDALSRLNDPQGVAQFAKSLNPIARQKLVAFYHDQPTYLTAIKTAIGLK